MLDVTKFKITNLCNIIDEAYILAFEQRIGVSLPGDYKEFLLRFGAAMLTPSTVPLTDPDGHPFSDKPYETGDVDLGIFYAASFRETGKPSNGLRDRNSLNEQYSEYTLDYGLDPDYIPIADGHANNIFLMKVKGEGAGGIYYWLNKRYCLLAHSFEAFLDKIPYVKEQSYEEFINSIKDDADFEWYKKNWLKQHKKMREQYQVKEQGEP
ncbi:SMI1/KNR4 family protein [Motilimonas sp. 1_MG-2023]|uniref:SMI1/KNR4 family protein n=1 Tax=Motilimonas sp. 1_MG-2023 TaxID=3062672 RepID=UPI0026E1E309|nr:SMI1/KNR4 family protein [Motilimonas sp. 1_MG-2023]MDO6528117.1 SMI1/KNR4 family protein [Motilimonas sp. 1_MG-2023]